MCSQNPQKILAISLYRFGDNLQITPMLQALKEKYPSAEIHVLTQKGFETVFDGNPCIDRIHLFHRDRYPAEAFSDLQSLREHADPVLLDLLTQSFDHLVNRQSSREGSMLAGLIPAELKRGRIAMKDGSFHLMDDWTRVLFAMVTRRRLNPFTVIDYHIRIGGVTPGKAGQFLRPRASGWENLWERIDRKPGEKLIAVQPGASTARRQWEPKDFGRMLRDLLGAHANIKAVVAGGPGEEGLAEKVVAQSGHPNRVFADCSLDFHQLAAFLQSCDLLVTNDTGPMHVAVAAGCKTLALFFCGSMVHEAAPYATGNVALQSDAPCIPCRNPEACAHHDICRRSMTPEFVASVAGWMLGLKSEPKEIPDGLLAYRTRLTDSGLLCDPLFKPKLDSEALTRILYSLVFREYVAGEPIDYCAEGKWITQSYLDAKPSVQAGLGLDLAPLQAFCNNEKELKVLQERFKIAYHLLRDAVSRA